MATHGVTETSSPTIRAAKQDFNYWRSITQDHTSIQRVLRQVIDRNFRWTGGRTTPMGDLKDRAGKNRRWYPRTWYPAKHPLKPR